MALAVNISKLQEFSPPNFYLEMSVFPFFLTEFSYVNKLEEIKDFNFKYFNTKIDFVLLPP